MKRTLFLSCILLASLALRAADDAGPFVKLRAGASILHDTKIKSGPARGADISFDPGYRVDFAVGYAFNSTCSLELETGVIGNSSDEVSGGGVRAGDVDLYQFPVFVNGIYKLPVDWPVRPFLGVGVGGAATIIDLTINGTGYRITGDDVDWTFAYQMFAGLAYPLGDAADVGLMYKFTGTTDHDWDGFKTDRILTHSLLAAIRFRF